MGESKIIYNSRSFRKYKQRSYRNRGKWNREGKLVWKRYQIARRARRSDLKKQARQLKRLKRKT